MTRKTRAPRFNYLDLRACLDADLAYVPSGFPCSDWTHKEIAGHMLAASFYKKLAVGPQTLPENAALAKLEHINTAMGEYTPFAAESSIEAEFFETFRSTLNRAVGWDYSDHLNFDHNFVANYMRTGPGSAQKAAGTDLFSKLFGGSISVYSGEYSDHLVSLYRAYCSHNDLWTDAEKLRFHKFGFCKVEGNQLFFAPKNADIARTCGTEASLNLLIQMAIGAFLEKRLLTEFGINLSTQPFLSRELARLGSVDGSFGTIDLVSASDCIRTRLVHDTLDTSFLRDMMEMSRATSTVLPDGRKLVLNMYSTMGNGFTFPFQTIIFASIVKATYSVMGIPHSYKSPTWSVFGDDIVVRREAYDFVARMLGKLGFLVNAAKSFNTGAFRESCGSDWWAGANVRGVYIKSLETHQQVYSAFNRLVDWSAKHDVRLPKTLRYLLRCAPDFRVPRSEEVDSGFKVPFVLCKNTKVSDRYWFRYRKFQVESKTIDFHEPSSSECINRPGATLTILHGSTLVSEGKRKVIIRDPPNVPPRYKVVSTEIPYWDYRGDRHPEQDVLAFVQQWGPLNLRQDKFVLNDDQWKKIVMGAYDFP